MKSNRDYQLNYDQHYRNEGWHELDCTSLKMMMGQGNIMNYQSGMMDNFFALSSKGKFI